MYKFLHNLMIPFTIYQLFDWRFSIPYFTSILLSWYIYKNECVLSYLYKKNKDINYYIGKNGFDTSDLIISSTNFNYLRIDILFYTLLVPYIYYTITKNVTKSILLGLITLITFIDNEHSNNLMKSRYRYILVVLLLYIITDTSILNNKYITDIFKILIFIGIFLTLLTFYKYRKYEDLNEMTIVGLLAYIYMIFRLYGLDKLLSKNI